MIGKICSTCLKKFEIQVISYQSIKKNDEVSLKAFLAVILTAEGEIFVTCRSMNSLHSSIIIYCNRICDSWIAKCIQGKAQTTEFFLEWNITSS